MAFEMPGLEALDASSELAARPDNEGLCRVIAAVLAERSLRVSVVECVEGRRVVAIRLALSREDLSNLRHVDSLLTEMLDVALGRQGVTVELSPTEDSDLLVLVPKRGESPLLRFREFVEDARCSGAAIPFVLGECVDGTRSTLDLARVGHCLVSGATGFGKSNALLGNANVIAMSKTPAEVRIVVVDLKGLDTARLRDYPHLWRPPATTKDEAGSVLEDLSLELANRKKALRAADASDVIEYNNRKASRERLPYLVVFIDEVQDLELLTGVASDLLWRLLAQSRALGIHFVVATQRPSVDVIPGRLRANLSMRVCFRVSNASESRIVLDHSGAERLGLPGDSLVLAPGWPTPRRFVCPHLSEAELAKIRAALPKDDAPPLAVSRTGQADSECLTQEWDLRKIRAPLERAFDTRLTVGLHYVPMILARVAGFWTRHVLIEPHTLSLLSDRSLVYLGDAIETLADDSPAIVALRALTQRPRTTMQILTPALSSLISSGVVRISGTRTWLDSAVRRVPTLKKPPQVCTELRDFPIVGDHAANGARRARALVAGIWRRSLKSTRPVYVPTWVR